jgi:cystathionine beta-lyase/cystathionine gamma-synthase
MRGFGAVVTLDLAGGEAAARAFCNATELFSLAEGLGGAESMIGYPFLMSHGAFPADEKRRKGITESTVRLSVGIENIDDLCDDLARALERSASVG